MEDYCLINSDEEKCAYYDYIVSKSLEQILNTLPQSSVITLTNFNVKDKGDLFVLEMLKICGLFGKTGQIDAGTISSLSYKTKNYLFDGVERVKDFNRDEIIDPKVILGEIKLKENLEDDLLFHMIYNEYYKPAPLKLRMKVKFDKFSKKVNEKFSKTKDKLDNEEEML